MKKSILVEVWITSLLLLAAGFFRFRLLGFSPFRTDTMEFYKLALRGQKIIEFWQHPPWMNQIPVNEILSLLLVKTGLPATPFVVRLPFATMGVLAVFFVWYLVRRRFGAGAALLTLLLAVFNPYQIYFSRAAYYYAGATCWSAALFLAFWSIKETLQQHKAPSRWQLLWWVAAAVAACHMHMSVWPVAGLQVGLLFLLGWSRLRENKSAQIRFYLQMLVGSLMVGVVLSRWIFRAFKMISGVSSGTERFVGTDAGAELLRLFPAYFAGENVLAIALLLLFVALTVYVCFSAEGKVLHFRSLAWICALQITVQILYVVFVGGGVAKISYFSAVWPHFIILIGVGVYLGVQALVRGGWRIAVYVLLSSGYIALTVWPDWAIVKLEGKPAPYYKINEWVLHNLPPGTPVLTDRWLEPWNELAVHNPGNINYTFTVPDEPIENYRRFNWRLTAEQFFQKYPDSALLELARDRYVDEMGPWAFRQTFFARCASITNDFAMVLRQWKVFPEVDYAVENTNRVVVRIFYNTTDDLLAKARQQGRDVLRLYGEGWGYAKLGWQQGHFEDYRILGQAASVTLYNLKDVRLAGSLEITAATADKPKTVSASGTTTVFTDGRIRTWSVPITLQSGKNVIPFASPSADPLFVLDIRWISSQP